MIKLNVHEAKTHLSEYLAKLEQGETIVCASATGRSPRSVPDPDITRYPLRTAW